MDSAVRATVAENFWPGKFLQGNSGLGSNLYIRRVRLRNAGVDAQRIDARHVKQFAAGSAGASVDERAGIDVAFGEHAGERAHRHP